MASLLSFDRMANTLTELDKRPSGGAALLKAYYAYMDTSKARGSSSVKVRAVSDLNASLIEGLLARSVGRGALSAAQAVGLLCYCAENRSSGEGGSLLAAESVPFLLATILHAIGGDDYATGLDWVGGYDEYLNGRSRLDGDVRGSILNAADAYCAK